MSKGINDAPDSNSIKSKQTENQEKELYDLKETYNSLLKEANLFYYDGDFSENGDLISLKEKNDDLIAKILIKEQQISESKNNNQQRSKITYLKIDTGEEKTVWLTDSWEADPEKNYISINSPLGSVLSICSEGSTEVVKTKNIKNNYKIKILFKQ